MLDTLESYSAVRRNGVPITSSHPFEKPEIDISTLIRQHDDWCDYGGWCLQCELPKCIYDGKADRPLNAQYDTPKVRATRERNERMMQDRQAGMTNRDIADKYGFKDPRSVREILNRLTPVSA